MKYEQQVAGLMARDRTISQVAELMSLSRKTVSNYRIGALMKLCCENNAKLMLFAIQNGLAE